MAKIKDLPKMAVYRRANGETYARLNSVFHVKTILKRDGSVTGNGGAERLDPEEDVVALADGR